MDHYIERLSQVRLFADCTPKELKDLARTLDEVHLPAGRRLTTEGETGREAFIIVSGEARVDRDGAEVARLGPGDYFGELSLLDAGPRNATVTAVDDMDVLVMGRRQFLTVLDDVPGLTRRLLFSTAKRLREASESELH